MRSRGRPLLLLPSLSSLQSEKQKDDSHLPAAREDAAGPKLRFASMWQVKAVNIQFKPASCCFLRVTCPHTSSWGNMTSCSLPMWLKEWGERRIGTKWQKITSSRPGVLTGRLCFSEGNLLLLNEALAKHETFFIRCGIFLILEKLKIITYRNLFKKVWVQLQHSAFCWLPLEQWPQPDTKNTVVMASALTGFDVRSTSTLLEFIFMLLCLLIYMWTNQKAVVSKHFQLHFI